MKVSIIIPTYNRARYVSNAIESALAQTYKDIEIIVVDDGSMDNTAEILRPYTDKVNYIRTENRGTVLARNLGINESSGDYIAILDDDDLYYPYKIELQCEILNKQPDVVMTYSEFSAFDNHGYFDEYHLKKYHVSAYRDGRNNYDRLFNRKIKVRDLLTAESALSRANPPWLGRYVYTGNIYLQYIFGTIVFTNSMLFRRDVLKSSGLLNSNYRLFYDLEFALRLCMQGDVSFCDVPTYKLRYHSEQVSTTQTDKGNSRLIIKQQDLLRVGKRYGVRDNTVYSQHKKRVDRHIANLCKTVAIPMLAQRNTNSIKFKNYSRRARKYLAVSCKYGGRPALLYLISYLPYLPRRIAFKVLEISKYLRSSLASVLSRV